jgi:hypothetical protein
LYRRQRQRVDAEGVDAARLALADFADLQRRSGRGEAHDIAGVERQARRRQRQFGALTRMQHALGDARGDILGQRSRHGSLVDAAAAAGGAASLGRARLVVASRVAEGQLDGVRQVGFLRPGLAPASVPGLFDDKFGRVDGGDRRPPEPGLELDDAVAFDRVELVERLQRFQHGTRRCQRAGGDAIGHHRDRLDRIGAEAGLVEHGLDRLRRRRGAKPAGYPVAVLPVLAVAPAGIERKPGHGRTSQHQIDERARLSIGAS